MELQRNGACQSIEYDNAANYYDLCYSKHSDTKTINDVYDKTMLNELDDIMNPTLKKRINKSIVGKLIKDQAHFGFRYPVKKIIKFTNELAEELHKAVSKMFERTS